MGKAIEIRRAKIIAMIVATVALLLGGSIYVAYRAETLLMFSWFPVLKSFRAFLRQHIALDGWPEWFLYALPDGMWILSYLLVIGTIWDFRMKDCILLLLLMPVIAISSEILQFFHLMHGTFDVYDLVFYTLFTAIGFYTIYNFNHQINKKL